MILLMYYQKGFGSPLLLTSVRRKKNGILSSGWVENGAWQLKIEDLTFKAYDFNKLVNTWDVEKWKAYDVPSHYEKLREKYGRIDYNSIINKTENYYGIIRS